MFFFKKLNLNKEEDFSIDVTYSFFYIFLIERNGVENKKL